MKIKLLIIWFAACTTLNISAAKGPEPEQTAVAKPIPGTPSKSSSNQPPQPSFFSRMIGKRALNTETPQLSSKNENKEEITFNNKDNIPVAQPIHDDDDDDEIKKTQGITFVQAKPINAIATKL